jgi:diguanylate cyclase (GGDEF)-like protein
VTTPAARPVSHWGLAACAALAAVSIVVGCAAVLFDEAALGLVAAIVGVGTAGVGAVIDLRRIRAEHALLQAHEQTGDVLRRLDTIEGARSDRSPTGGSTDDWEIDPASGLVRERHLPVVLQQVVAAARRKIQPVSVVYWRLDGLDQAPRAARDEALNVLGAVAWRTMREGDTVFRLGEFAALGVLVDTAEPGSVVVADRVREALRASPVGDSLTVSAGIACYPSHALDAVELVARAGRALEAAEAEGYERDYVIIAANDQE